MSFLGSSSGTNVLQGNDLNNSTAVGANSYTTTNNQIVLGDPNVTEVSTAANLLSNGLQSTSTSLPMRLRYSAGVNADFIVDSAGKLKVLSPLSWTPAATHTPTVNGELAVEMTSNTLLTFRLRGTDGTVRSATLTLT